MKITVDTYGYTKEETLRIVDAISDADTSRSARDEAEHEAWMKSRAHKDVSDALTDKPVQKPVAETSEPATPAPKKAKPKVEKDSTALVEPVKTYSLDEMLKLARDTSVATGKADKVAEAIRDIGKAPKLAQVDPANYAALRDAILAIE